MAPETPLRTLAARFRLMARPDAVADPTYRDKLERRDERKLRLDRHERPGAKHGNISDLPIRIAAVIMLARALSTKAAAGFAFRKRDKITEPGIFPVQSRPERL